MICTGILGAARRKIPVSPCIVEFLHTYERVIEQVLSSPPFRDRSERRLNKLLFVLMHRRTRNQYLTLTEACPCDSLLHSNTSYFRFTELKATASPFLFLAVDLPPPPLFQDAVEKNIIPQVGIHSVLAKYDGVQTQVGLIHRASFFSYFVFTSIIYRALRSQEVNYVGSIANSFRHMSLFNTKGSQETTS